MISLLKKINKGHVNRYLRYLKDEGRSNVTVTKNRYILNKLLQDTHGVLTIRNLLYHKKRLLRHRVFYRGIESDQQKSSVNTIIFTTISFLKWLRFPIPTKFKLKYNKRGLPKHLRPAEIEELKKQMPSLPLMDRNTIRCMLLMGMRLSEVVNLKVDDVDIRDRMVSLVGKGGLSRTILIPKEVFNELNEWLLKRVKIKTESDHLFVKKSGHEWISIYPVYVQRRLKTISKKLYPHRLRHTFAIRSILSGVPINVVQDILGHTNLATTSIYTKATGAMQNLAMDKIKSWW